MRLNQRNLLCILAVFATSAVFSAGQTKNDPPAASENSYRAGALSFSFPSPGNNLVETGPDYRVLLEPLAPDSNRLVTAFVPSDAMDALHAGTKPALQEYALIEVLRRAEFVNIDDETFKQVVAGVGQQLSSGLAGSIQASQEELDHRLKALGSNDSVTLDKPLQLGTLFSKPDASGFGMVMLLTVKEGTVKVAAAISVIRVHSRIFFAYFYIPFKDETTISQLRTRDEQWTDAILNANR